MSPARRVWQAERRWSRGPVRSIVYYVLRQGLTPEELIREFPQLTLPKIYDALSFYYDHQEDMDAEMIDNTEAAWRHSK